jgi:cytochrome b pre-mRNA-processing protein 3
VIFLTRRRLVREAADRAYRQVVDQARQPIFFTEFGVPDTLDGRFELICLHAFLYLYRLRSERPLSSEMSQAFFDAMFADMDRGMREMGTGDLSVGRHVKQMARGFYGRIRAYQTGLDNADDAALGNALARNLFGTVDESAGDKAAMTGYVRRAAGELARQTAADLLAGKIGFPDPAGAGSGAMSSRSL